MRRLLAIAVVVSLMAAPVGYADDATGHVQGYLDRAEAFWADRGAHVDCPAGIRVEWEALVDEWAEAGGCMVWIDPVQWHRSPLPRMRCTIILHEYGHLLGLTHEAGGVMAVPVGMQPTKRCRFSRLRARYY